MKLRIPATIAFLAALFFVTAVAVHAYSTFGGKWKSFPVVLFLNPANHDVTASAAVTAIQSAINAWNTQSGSSFRYQYGGTVNDTATSHDYRNVMFFRNVSNGGVIATTYSWWESSGKALDSDVVFWDGGFKFYTGTSGCSSGVYIEDVATHELGHALGLGHSSASDATMYSTYTLCTQAKRTLASDDIAGAKALYPLTTTVTNTAPTVVITSPANGSTINAGTSFTLKATATDQQDGDLSSRVQWFDNGAPIGTGGVLSKTLSLIGIHTFTAKVTDNNGAQASSQVSVTITLLSSSTSGTSSTQGTLTAQKIVNSTNTIWRAYLYWSGVQGTYVDVYRNGTKIYQTGNDGAHADPLSLIPGTYVYKMCKTATQVCTNSVSLTY
jgi:hypothetical protein